MNILLIFTYQKLPGEMLIFEQKQLDFCGS